MDKSWAAKGDSNRERRIEKQTKKRLVVVAEGSFAVFGPFKSILEVEDYLKGCGFVRKKEYCWVKRDDPKLLVHIRGVNRPRGKEKKK